jgi:hypothetical protein
MLLTFDLISDKSTPRRLVESMSLLEDKVLVVRLGSADERAQRRKDKDERHTVSNLRRPSPRYLCRKVPEPTQQRRLLACSFPHGEQKRSERQGGGAEEEERFDLVHQGDVGPVAHLGERV